MTPIRGVLALLVLVAAAGLARAEDQPRRVLILHSFGQRIAPFNAVATPFRQELVRRSPEPLAISEVSLAAADGSDPDGRVLADYLRALFGPQGPDLVVAIGGPAARFVQGRRAELFPEVPLLIAATEARRIDRAALTDRDVAVTHVVDVPGVIDTILAVQPATRRVVVVLGASPLERLWRQFAEQDLAGYAGRIAFEWVNDLDFEGILARVAALPPDTAVLYGLMIVDAAGVPFEEDEAIEALSAASAVPVYGIYDSQLGEGIVGGRMLPVAAIASRSADAALRLLAGEPAAAIRVPPLEAGPPTFDSRQLARFGIAADRLPPGSRLRFRELTLWDRYRWPILGVLALCLMQSTLITGLLVGRRRLRQSRAALITSEERLRAAAEAARDFAGRLIHAQENERSRLGRELHDDITQRLAVLAIVAGQCERKATDAAEAAAIGEVRGGLARLGEDVHALSYQLHPSILADLGLVAALESEAGRVGRIEGLPVELETGPLPDGLPPAAALCLFRVAQEALRNAVRHAGARRARLTLAADGAAVRLVVEDDGRGFVPDEPRARPSLGLASMRQRVAAAGGALRLRSAPGAGTRIEVTLPIEEAGEDAATAVAR